MGNTTNTVESPMPTPCVETAANQQVAFDARRGMSDSNKLPRYVASSGWGHIFVGNREEQTRWIYDVNAKMLVSAQVLNAHVWVNLDAAPMIDLLESIHDNEAIENPADFDLRQFNSMPSWQTVENGFESSVTSDGQHCVDGTAKQANEICIDYHFADNEIASFVGVFATTRSAYEAGESPDTDDVVQVVVNAADSVVCDVMQDAVESACRAANESLPLNVSQALLIASKSLTDSGKAANPAVAELANALMRVSTEMSQTQQADGRPIAGDSRLLIESLG